MQDYLEFLRQHGLPLSSINPGSEEFALSKDDAFKGIEILRNNHIAILGGDILSRQDEGQGQLIYAYQLWGTAYHTLNWYCSKMEDESDSDYANRSYKIALEKIEDACDVGRGMGYDCFIVLVV